MAAILEKDELKHLPTLSGASNYPIWSTWMKGYLLRKKLWDTVNNDPGEAPTQRVKDLLAESAHILCSKISN